MINGITKILSIETSCDETSASIIEICHPKKVLRAKGFQRDSSTLSYNDNFKLKIVSNIVSSQIHLHKKYGGVYPELASREHIKNIIPVIEQALYLNNKFQITNSKSNSNLKINKLNHLKLIKNYKLKTKNLFNDIDYIAVTTGPGLIGSLLVGVNTAKTISYATNIPIIPINHLEGHIYANFINDVCANDKLQITKDINPKKLKSYKANKLPRFPILALIVSGGHTSLYLMRNHAHYKLIGETLDDAAGEAYDKVASMLDLPYPGGPEIDKIASKLQATSYKLQAIFPRPMINSHDFNFSFSGLKTSVLYYLKKQENSRHKLGSRSRSRSTSGHYSKKLQEKVCYEFQEAVTDVLVAKTLKAAQKYKVASIVLGGGVAANSRLRSKLAYCISQIANSKNNKRQAISYKPKLFMPKKFLCTDNAAVIGVAAAYKLLKDKPSKWYDIEANSNAEL
jgi:N6-L-threonylcarbamoyladenine synthase